MELSRNIYSKEGLVLYFQKYISNLKMQNNEIQTTDKCYILFKNVLISRFCLNVSVILYRYIFVIKFTFFHKHLDVFK